MSLSVFRKLFGTSKMAIIGMIHVKALPGTPKSCNNIQEILDGALHDLEIYKMNGIDGVLMENMADLPYIQAKDFGPEIVATMTRIATTIRLNLPLNIPCGIQVLAGGNKEALAISKVCGLQFIRSEGFVFSHVADEGWMDSCAGNLLRYRKFIGCEDVLIFADIKKKHSAHSITSDISVSETAKAAEFFLADGVILTGTSTGKEANPNDLQDVKNITKIPILIGSGISTENVEKFSGANGFIVGSHFKKSDKWDGHLDSEKVKIFMKKVTEVRKAIAE